MQVIRKRQEHISGATSSYRDRGVSSQLAGWFLVDLIVGRFLIGDSFISLTSLIDLESASWSDIGMGNFGKAWKVQGCLAPESQGGSRGVFVPTIQQHMRLRQSVKSSGQPSKQYETVSCIPSHWRR